MAEKTGLSVRAISGLERGEGHAPRPGTVAYLSGALELPSSLGVSLAESTWARSAVSGRHSSGPSI